MRASFLPRGAARWIGAWSFAGLLCTTATALSAQATDRDTSIDDLPRTGFEARTLAIGSTTISPSLEAGVVHDDNIIATNDRALSDAIFAVRPAVAAQRKSPGLGLRANMHAEILRYASYERENVDTFGAALSATKPLASGQSLTADTMFDRSYQSRSDPEAALDNDRTRSPALINLTTGSLQYAYSGARFGLVANGSAENLDFLSAADANRDLSSYHGSVRLLATVAPHVSVYVEPYVNRRSFRMKSSLSNLFGDTTTIGSLGGVSFDLADRLQGSVGLGIFSANPDGSLAKTYRGMAASGRIIWHPRVRTVVAFNLFRGDVATIRAGSLGRIDTRVGVSVDQEIRHNLLATLTGGYRRIEYVRGADASQRYLVGEGELRYLLNRYLTASLQFAYTRRAAQLPDERFERKRIGVGLRYAFGKV